MAARAPRPEVIRQQADQDRAFIITVDNVPVRLVVADLGPKDASRIRKLDLNVSLAGLMSLLGDEERMDLDLVAALWWLARVKAGEDRLSFDTALDQFPGYQDFADRVSIEQADDEPEDDTPEA